MKSATCLLILTLALNLVLGWVALNRRNQVSKKSAETATPVVLLDPLLGALESGGSAALRAAGAPESVVRNRSLGHSLTLLVARIRAVKPAPPPDSRYWRNERYYKSPYTREQRAEIAAARSEFAESLRTLLGEDVSVDPSRTPSRAYLPAAKQERLARIEKDYADMISEIYAEAGSVRLPSDDKKVKFLESEKLRDMGAVLTASDQELLDLHESQAAREVSNFWGEAIGSEADFRTVLTLKKATDEKYLQSSRSVPGMSSPGSLALADQKLAEEIRATLGDDKLNSMIRAGDQDHRLLSILETRGALAGEAVNQAIVTRDSYAGESQRINSDSSLSSEEKGVQIKSLAVRARYDLDKILGSAAAEAYVPRASWIRSLTDGDAFSADPKKAPGSVPILRFFATPIQRPESTVGP